MYEYIVCHLSRLAELKLKWHQKWHKEVVTIHENGKEALKPDGGYIFPCIAKPFSQHRWLSSGKSRNHSNFGVWKKPSIIKFLLFRVFQGLSTANRLSCLRIKKINGNYYVFRPRNLCTRAEILRPITWRSICETSFVLINLSVEKFLHFFSYKLREGILKQNKVICDSILHK